MDCSPPGSSVHGILQAGTWSGLPFPTPGVSHHCRSSIAEHLWIPKKQHIYKRTHTYIYIYIYIYIRVLFHFFAIMIYHGMLNIVPCAMTKRKLLKNKGWARTALGFPSGKAVQNPTAIQEPRALSLNWENPLEKEIAIHSSVIAWNIPWTDGFSRLQSVGSQRVRCTHIGHLRQLGSTDLKDSRMRSLRIHLLASQHSIQNLGTLIPTLALCSSSRPCRPCFQGHSLCPGSPTAAGAVSGSPPTCTILIYASLLSVFLSCSVWFLFLVILLRARHWPCRRKNSQCVSQMVPGLHVHPCKVAVLTPNQKTQSTSPAFIHFSGWITQGDSGFP